MIIHDVVIRYSVLAYDKWRIIVEVDAFIADDVESVGGKLYTLGAAWNVIRTEAVPTRHHRLALGIIVRVPYTATNQKHTVEVYLEDQDGDRMTLNEAGQVPEGEAPLKAIKGEFNVGRPPELPAGAEQVVPIAMRFNNLMLEKLGTYRFVMEIDGTQVKVLPFRIEVPLELRPR
jgi:hypothetical protein